MVQSLQLQSQQSRGDFHHFVHLKDTANSFFFFCLFEDNNQHGNFFFFSFFGHKWQLLESVQRVGLK